MGRLVWQGEGVLSLADEEVLQMQVSQLFVAKIRISQIYAVSAQPSED